MAAPTAHRAHSTSCNPGRAAPVACIQRLKRHVIAAHSHQRAHRTFSVGYRPLCQAVQPWRAGCRRSTRAQLQLAAAAADGQNEAEDAAALLSELLSWCLANGVSGIGAADSKLALYEGQGGERGMLCIQDIEAGEEVLQIPLTLALTDHPADEESNALVYEGAPWSVRLSAKLLREKAKGKASPWHPYIQTLPRLVPAPLSVMSWEEMQEIEVPAAQTALYEHDWLIADSFKRCSAEALGGASEEEFKWAMSIVHSRTFGTAAEKGGVGVRMLLPLVDMFNHGGDEAALPSQTATGQFMPAAVDEVLAADNVRWDLMPPPASPEAAKGGGSWVMCVSATYQIGRQEAALLSYGERPNLDFFLHYGFVPRANPHEAVVLFEGLEEALEWHAQRYDGVQAMAELSSQAQELYSKALQAGQQEQEQAKQQQLEQLKQRQQQQQLRENTTGVASISGRSETGEDRARLELLSGGRVGAPLVAAFAALHGGAGRSTEAAALAAIAARCWQLLGSFTPALADLAALLLDAAARGDGEQEGYYAVLLHYHHQAIMPAYEAACSTSTSNTSGDPTRDLAQALLQHYGKAEQSAVLSSGRRLAYSYRAEQKMVLWGAVLAAKAPLDALQPQGSSSTLAAVA